jgi:hypothetical protein
LAPRRSLASIPFFSVTKALTISPAVGLRNPDHANLGDRRMTLVKE